MFIICNINDSDRCSCLKRKTIFFTYLLVKLTLLSKNDIADIILDDAVLADKSPACNHVTKLFTLPLASELKFIVFPTAASICKLFLFAII
jgi:hypothetical protein